MKNPWWEEPSGKIFRHMIESKGGTKEEILAWIYANTGINPSVVDKWKKGGNPSIVNLSKILKALDCPEWKFHRIISELREFKNKKECISKTKDTNITEYIAIINEFDPENKKYWLRVYDVNGRFITGDRITKYGYAFQYIKTPNFRARVTKVVNNNNFTIMFNPNLSIPEITK